MSRLPTPGGDDGNWGSILNDFLSVEHNSDGSLKARTDGSLATLSAGKVPATQLGSGTADATTFLRGDNTWATPVGGGSVSDATTTAKGVVQLAGDLGGSGTTAAAPKIAATANVNAVVNSVIASNATVTGAAQKSANLSDLASAATARTNLGLATVAASGSYTDLSNKPTIPTVSDATTTAKGIVQLAGDLSGTATAPSVAKVNGVNVSGAPTGANQVLTSTSATAAAWSTPASGFADPTTTKGDLIVHGSSTTRLPVGTDTQVLTADSTQALGVKWATPSATDATKVPLSTVTTKGDLIAATGNATVTRLPAGSNGQVLSADSTQSSGLKWVSAGSTAQLQGVAVYVEDYGAVGDGTTDDTTAIKNAINAAVTAAASGNHYAEVRFQSKIYLLSGSLSQGGTPKANALLPLPMISGTANKITLCLKGVGEASALPLGTQTVGQKTGTILKTTVTGTNDGTYGEASVLGGPTDAQGGGYNAGTPLFNNMCVVIDGIGFSLPNDPHICGMDFRGVAEVVIKNAGVFVDAGVSSIAAPTQLWQFALAMPEARNNALCHIERFGVYGSNYGVRSSEHTTATWFAAILCNVGIAVGKASGPHHSRYNYACLELCNIAVGATDQYGYIDIAMLDFEGTAGNFNTNFSSYAIVEDSNYLSNGGFATQYGKMQGTIRVNNNGDPLYNRSSMIHGGTLLNIYCANTASGDPTKTYNLHQPSVPSTATTYQNTFWRDAAVVVSGGTVSAIKVDGVTTGATSGMVFVPSGRTIELDYTVAPTWNWTLL